MSTTLSVIIPAYNEEKRIGKTLDNVSTFLRAQKISFEIIVVTNNCTDSTRSLVESIKSTSIPELVVVDIPHEGVAGNIKGYAIGTGMKIAKGDYHIFIDADNATRFSHVTEFIEYAKGGYDVVIASRYIAGAHIVKKQPLYRIVLSRLGNLLIRIVLLPRVYDTQCGFKLFTSRASKEVFSRMTIPDWGADLEMLAISKAHGLKIKEVPVYWEAQGGSTIRSNAFTNTLRDLFVIRANVNRGLYNK
jgi:dolichyl-phosphate beta-glucosyltransferase